MTRSASQRASGPAAQVKSLSCALLVIMGFSGELVLAQPFERRPYPQAFHHSKPGKPFQSRSTSSSPSRE